MSMLYWRERKAGIEYVEGFGPGEICGPLLCDLGDVTDTESKTPAEEAPSRIGGHDTIRVKAQNVAAAACTFPGSIMPNLLVRVLSRGTLTRLN
jgi:hypothetical protein